MNRANFYGQPGFNSCFMRNWPSFILSKASARNLECFRSGLVHEIAFTFEQKLKNKMDNIRQNEQRLKERIAAYKAKPAEPNARKEIISTYSRLEKSKKLMSIIVEHMQKIMQNIASNFH